MNEPDVAHDVRVHVDSTYTPRCLCGWVGGTYRYQRAAEDSAELHRVAMHVTAEVAKECGHDWQAQYDRCPRCSR